MTEYAYDPEFPYLVVDAYVIAKFPAGERGRDDAQSVAEGYGWDFVDTTPKPKIPEDAEFIFWLGGPRPVEYYARRVGHPANKVWRNDEGEQVSEEDLLREIGDAEVTVLVPKEES